MPKDYKDAPSHRGDARPAHPMLLGIIIGVLLGILISLAVALWLNRLSNPFVERGRAPALPHPGEAPPGQPPGGGAAGRAGGAQKPAAAGERPRFEFYQILPGGKEAGQPEGKASAPATPAGKPPAAAAVPRPGSSPASPKPHSGDVYWLQAGAFAEEREADNLRAKIALTGLEASVIPVSVPDKGKLYRVRLGPYQSVDDATRIKATLAHNGVGASIIRLPDEAKNP